MNFKRRKTRKVKVGNVVIGSGYPIVVQSMVKSKTCNVRTTVNKIHELERLGCSLVRVAVKDNKDAKSLKDIKKNIHIPLIADIHFDKNLALQAIDNGVDKIRLNPGNIYKKIHVREIVKAAKQAHIPIRVGVNSGSVLRSQSINKIRNADNPGDLLVKSMIRVTRNYLAMLEDFGFYDIVVSIKGADAISTIEANLNIARMCNFHYILA